MPFDPRHVAFFSCSYFPDPTDPIQQVRARLAISAINAVREQGFSLVLVDGGSDPAIFDTESLDIPVITSDIVDMVESRQLAARSALEMFPQASYFVWTEPEKDLSTLVDVWITRGLVEDASVILPMRLHMETYPLFQQLSERKGNEDIAACFDREMGDHYFGPRVFRQDALIKHWLRNYSDYETKARQWASIMSPLFGALAAGEKVIGVPVDFKYPLEQNAIETTHSLVSKRLMQRQVITQCAYDIHDYLAWAEDWQLTLLDGYTLESQTMDQLDLTVTEPLDIVNNYY